MEKTNVTPGVVALGVATYVPKIPTAARMAVVKNGGELGVDEVIDYAVDVYNFGEFVYNRFRDGVQPLSDGAALLSQREQIEEFISDFPTFKAQAKDIAGNEPTEIVNGIVARLGVSESKARKIFVDAIVFGAATWESVTAGKKLARHFFGGDD